MPPETMSPGGSSEPATQLDAGGDADAASSPQASNEMDAAEGQTPDAGTMVTEPPARPSSGCGASDWPESGQYTIDVNGTMREYIVTLPDAYAPDTPHRLVFAFHGRGGTAQQVSTGGGYYGLAARAAGTTIFVAGQGLASAGGGAGWSNTGGRDIAFTRAMLDSLRSSYCIDEGRVFATGMSYGGFMATTVGCQLGDVMRAIAPMSGGGNAFFGSPCVGQVAVWYSHGNQDAVVSFDSGLTNRDHWLMANHCDSAGIPVDPSPCLQYPGCDDGYPVHFCEFDGGHTVPSFAGEAIWNFFSKF